MTSIQGPDGQHIKIGGYVTTPETTTTTSTDKPQKWIHTTTSKVEVTQNKDGSFTESKTTTDSSGTTTQNTTYEFDANGNKIIKSVSTETAEFYGSHNKVEYVDKDGDGYADYKIETSINPEGKPIKTKFKGKPVNPKDKNARNMYVLSGDKSKLIDETPLDNTLKKDPEFLEKGFIEAQSSIPTTDNKNLQETFLKKIRNKFKIEHEFHNDEEKQIKKDREESIQKYQNEEKEAKLAEFKKQLEQYFKPE